MDFASSCLLLSHPPHRLRSQKTPRRRFQPRTAPRPARPAFAQGELAGGQFAVEIDGEGFFVSAAGEGDEKEVGKKKRNPFQHTFLHESMADLTAGTYAVIVLTKIGAVPRSWNPCGRMLCV